VKIEKILSPYGQMKLIDGPSFLTPENEIEVAPKLLRYSIDKSAGTFARIYRPQRTVALTSRDKSTDGYSNALLQAKSLGFTPVLRSPGGRAVAYHEESLVLDLMSHDANPHELINERFEAIGEIFIETFDRLGIHAEIGQLHREFCPGKYSVISQNVKLVGTAQRITRGGWLIGASVIVRNVAPVREVLKNVYRALDLDMDPSTVGSLNEINSSISVDEVTTALIATLKENFAIMDIDLSINFENKNSQLVGA
jgi:lipoate-protein ligase A